jgi:5-methylcytosine-specific restriction endonuclease McrA
MCAWFGTTRTGQKAAQAVKSKRRQLREKNAERIEGEDVSLDAIFARDNGLCSICRLPVVRGQASLDHVIPLSEGGSHTEENVRLAHKRCNSKKGAKTGPKKKGLRRRSFKPKPKPKPPDDPEMF